MPPPTPHTHQGGRSLRLKWFGQIFLESSPSSGVSSGGVGVGVWRRSWGGYFTLVHLAKTTKYSLKSPRRGVGTFSCVEECGVSSLDVLHHLQKLWEEQRQGRAVNPSICARLIRLITARNSHISQDEARNTERVAFFQRRLH